MDDVAAALGVSKPLVYQHFSGKQSLLEAVFDAAARDVRLDWIVEAAELEIPFDRFLFETGTACAEFVNQTKTIDAYQLILREGLRQPGLRAAFVSHVGRPIVLNMRSIILSAIEKEECRDLEPRIVQRMISAPMYLVMSERAVFGATTFPPEEAAAFFKESYASLIDRLCLKRSSF